VEPRIQYAQTKDGVSIAFWTLGEGMPLVAMPGAPWSHIQLEWQSPEFRRWYERMAEKRMLIRYDGRGTGLSERDVSDFSMDAYLLDLEAVVEHLGLERFALLGTLHAGPVAVTYTVRHPERVSRLVLWCSYARAADIYRTPQGQALRGLRKQDWTIYTESAAHSLLGWERGEQARRLAELVRQAYTQRVAVAALRAIEGFDVSALLSQVRSQTLVAHPRQVPLPPVDAARGLASRIPDARLVVLESAAVLPLTADDIEVLVGAIDEFLSEAEEAVPTPELPEGMAVLLFADIAESTALTEKLGDTAFRQKAREMDTSLRSVIKESGGTPVEGKVLGDGVLAVFTSARQAIDCALRCEAAGEPLGLRLHLGIHAGDVIREGNNVYGGAVNIAARIAAASEPGEVLVSDTVRSLGRTSADVTFDDRGEHTLKGVGEPQRLFAVRGGG
jgi:class 3 adenylate cyclase